jgi:ClpP class serine protease
MKWLVANEVAQDMRAKLAAGLAPSREAEAEFSESIVARARSEGAPSNLSVAGDVAQIDVVGLLTERPDFIAWLFGYGNTTYEDIQSAIAIAEANPAVKRLQYNIASPGGTIAGLFETLAAIDDGKKPKSVVTSFAASAAYAIASRAGRITATTAATEVGSIGVAISFYVDESIIDIASTKAPKKRPDVSTEEGQATVREELDALHDLFVEAIAGGRGTTVEDVNANFGQGGLLVAVEAKRRGMIDKILRPSLRAVSRANAESEAEPDATAGEPVGVTAADSAVAPTTIAAPVGGAATTSRKHAMTKEELKAQNPDIYEAVREEGRKEGHAKGLEDGVAKERDRVGAHLIRGKASGAMDLAIESVTNGSEMTETLRAKYDTSGRNRDDDAARQAECNEAVGATAGAKKPADEQKSMATQVADLMCKRAGIGV